MQIRMQSTIAIISFLLQAGLSTAGAQAARRIDLQTRPTGQGSALCGSCTVPDYISSLALLVGEDEPGERMILSGTVYKSDGVTPDSGITLFVYQTDAGGYYHRPEEDVFHPRIVGWLRTGSDGRYEIHTIKPAPEILVPTEPAHIHVHIFGRDMPEHFLHEFWFQGDANISGSELKEFSLLGEFSPIVHLKQGADGIWRGTRNIRVKPAPAWRYESE